MRDLGLSYQDKVYDIRYIMIERKEMKCSDRMKVKYISS